MIEKKRSRAEVKHDWYIRNRERHLEKNNKWHKTLRREIIDRYGGKCNCCGETILDFLAIDHIAGGGNQHRKEIGCQTGGTRFYIWLRQNNYPSGFQVLCHNCNFSKNLNKGLCIHQVNRMNEDDTQQN